MLRTRNMWNAQERVRINQFILAYGTENERGHKLHKIPSSSLKLCFYMDVKKWDKKVQAKLTHSKNNLLTFYEQVVE